MRYFDTQAHCDACPLIVRKTPEQKTQARRDYQNQRQAERRAAGIKQPTRQRDPRSQREPGTTVAAPPPKRTLIGEPIITERTKVTILPTPVDARYHVDSTHRGDFSRDWQAKRGEAVTC